MEQDKKNILKFLLGKYDIQEKISIEIPKQIYIRFDRDKYLTFGEGDQQIEYKGARTRKEKEASTTVKYGQLKLFLAELQFFNLYFDPEKHKNPVCLYIGAALGTHIATLAKMYPMIQFKLYDPSDFNHQVLDPLDNVEIFQQYFEDTDMEEWATKQQSKEMNVFLLVDIRNLNYQRIQDVDKNRNKFRNNEKLVIDDMNLQRKWFEGIKPTKALLKMRLPYFETFLTGPEIIFDYLDGTVYRQQFASQTSSETRFVPYDVDTDGKYPTRVWNIKTYESITNAHNKEIREKGLFINPFSHTDPTIQVDDPIAEKIGLYNDYDSTAASLIIIDYLTKFKVDPNYTQFYQLTKEIFIDVGRSKVFNYNLKGLREKLKFVDEFGEEVENNPKVKKGTEDEENNPEIRE